MSSFLGHGLVYIFTLFISNPFIVTHTSFTEEYKIPFAIPARLLSVVSKGMF